MEKTDAQWNPTAEELISTHSRHKHRMSFHWVVAHGESPLYHKYRERVVEFHAKIEALDEAADREIGWVACRIAFRRWWLMNHDLESHAEQMICELITEEMGRDDQ